MARAVPDSGGKGRWLLYLLAILLAVLLIMLVSAQTQVCCQCWGSAAVQLRKRLAYWILIHSSNHDCRA